MLILNVLKSIVYLCLSILKAWNLVFGRFHSRFLLKHGSAPVCLSVCLYPSFLIFCANFVHFIPDNYDLVGGGGADGGVGAWGGRGGQRGRGGGTGGGRVKE